MMIVIMLMISDLNTMKMIREDVTVMPPMQPVASDQILTTLGGSWEVFTGRNFGNDGNSGKNH